MVSVNQHVNLREKFPGWFKRSGIKKGTFSLDRWGKQSPDSKKITESNNHKSSLLATWAESFIFAGSSALLLLIASLSPAYWYFSFFALVPFLYRTIKATTIESLRLGILLGISFFSVSITQSHPISPSSSVFKLLLGTGLFAIFSWTVRWARKHWGFYPSIVALLWVGLEIGLMKAGITGGLLGKIESSNTFFHGLVGLFGFLIVSVIIVLLNSILVLVIDNSLELNRIKEKTTQGNENKWWFSNACNIITKQTYMMSEERGPPSNENNNIFLLIT
jgi:hypothetical protein